MTCEGRGTDRLSEIAGKVANVKAPPVLVVVLSMCCKGSGVGEFCNLSKSRIAASLAKLKKAGSDDGGPVGLPPGRRVRLFSSFSGAVSFLAPGAFLFLSSLQSFLFWCRSSGAADPLQLYSMLTFGHSSK